MRLARRPVPWQTLDLVAAVLLAADLVLESLLAHGVPSVGRLPTAIAAIPFALPVAARRRWPALALPVAVTVALVQQLFHGQLFTTLPSQSAAYVPILCSYGVGAWLETRRGAAVVGAAALLLYGGAAVASAQHVAGAPGWLGGVGLSFFFLIPAWVIGCVVRERGRRAQAFAELERGALAERAQRELAAVAEERALIGRELQDIIAHSVSVMVVQVGGARRLLGSDPGRARESMLAVERTGREALAEMRRLLGVLRREDDPRALAPQPGLAQLPDLFALLERRGFTCEAALAAVPALTPGVDLVAYRVAEAVLTAVAEQGAAAAGIAIGSDRRGLYLEIHAPGANPTVAEGLAAVGERVALYDGRIDFADERGGLLVRCQLPLGTSVAA